MKNNTNKACTGILKKIVLFVLVLIQTTMSFAQTKLWMGKAELVGASTLQKQFRTIEMSMDRNWESIPTDFLQRAGGVSFVEVAMPSETFKVNTLSLGCDYEKNKAFATINGTRYDIPLDVWMLQPIVEYANDKNNVAVTLYGGDPSSEEGNIRFHRAFIDNLLGLRLLQTDLLLASNYVNPEDICKLPSYKENDIVLGPNEKYDENSACQKSEQSRNSISNLIEKLGSDGYYSSYIYTDFHQSIVFDTNKGEIKMSGRPYYLFVSRTIDSIAIYRYYQAFFDSFGEPLESDSTIAEVLRIAKYDISEEQKARMFFDVLDSVSYHFFSALINSNDYLKTEYRESPILTNHLKNHNSIVKDLNPIVVTAAQATCQWAAFFRYVKENYPKSWNSFCNQVKQLRYDARKDVYTPIKIIYH